MMRLTGRTVFFIVFVSISGIAASSPVGSITGTVYDADSYEKIAGAVVSVGDSPHRANTDSTGRFTVSAVAPGTYTVEARKEGYSALSRYSVVVNPNARVSVDFPLGALVRNLDKMVVTYLPIPGAVGFQRTKTVHPFQEVHHEAVRRHGSRSAR